jgi:hypothetical protein
MDKKRFTNQLNKFIKNAFRTIAVVVAVIGETATATIVRVVEVVFDV